MTKLLSVGSDSKTTKGTKKGYLTGICYLTPWKSAHDNKNLCSHATTDCAFACLAFAGRARDERPDSGIALARHWRRHLWIHAPEVFFALLALEVAALVRRATKLGLAPCVRLNGTSDILWERYPEFHELCQTFSQVQFYDYTKVPLRNRRNRPTNYHLTFSWSGENDAECRIALTMGANVAVPYLSSLPLSDTFGLGKPTRVINGDESDLRFLDRPGVIVGLKNKPVSAKRLAKTGCQQFAKVPTMAGRSRHALAMA